MPGPDNQLPDEESFPIRYARGLSCDRVAVDETAQIGEQRLVELGTRYEQLKADQSATDPLEPPTSTSARLRTALAAAEHERDELSNIIDRISAQLTRALKVSDPSYLAHLEAKVAAAYAFADDMADFCSPHGVAVDYAEKLRSRLDAASAADIRMNLTEHAKRYLEEDPTSTTATASVPRVARESGESDSDLTGANEVKESHSKDPEHTISVIMRAMDHDVNKGPDETRATSRADVKTYAPNHLNVSDVGETTSRPKVSEAPDA